MQKFEFRQNVTGPGQLSNGEVYFFFVSGEVYFFPTSAEARSSNENVKLRRPGLHQNNTSRSKLNVKMRLISLLGETSGPKVKFIT